MKLARSLSGNERRLLESALAAADRPRLQCGVNLQAPREELVQLLFGIESSGVSAGKARFATGAALPIIPVIDPGHRAI